MLTLPGRETCSDAATEVTRRQILVVGAGVALLASGRVFSAEALAGTGKEAAIVDAGLTADRDFGAFISVSRRLTGRQSLDLKVARRIYDTLTAQDPDLIAAVDALDLFWQEHDGVRPADLTRTLQQEIPKLAGLPITLISAWYLGHVGAARTVITYEDALMFAPVADVLTPPSYCNGVMGYWAAEPGPI